MTPKLIDLQRNFSRPNRCACCLFVALTALALPNVAHAVRLVPEQVYMSHYHNPYLDGVLLTTPEDGYRGNRADALTILDNGVVDHGGANDRIDTFMNDQAGAHPDFVGLSYGEAYRFDSITIELGKQFYALEAQEEGYINPSGIEQFVTGGDWAALPQVYILRNSNLIGSNSVPSHSANWVEVFGATETTGHAFSPTVTASGPGGTITLDLTGIPEADRTGWGWAVEGEGSSFSPAFSNPGHFVTLTEAYADGVSVSSPSQYIPETPKPTNVVSNRFRSPNSSTPTFSDVPSSIFNDRGPAFTGVTNGHFRNRSEVDGFVTGHGPPTEVTDFVGLHYSTQATFDTITLNMSTQYAVGGNWESMPKVYLLKKPIDNGSRFLNLRPEENPDIYVEIDPEDIGLTVFQGSGEWNTLGPDITDTYEFAQDFTTVNTVGVNMVFDLTAASAEARTGWGWAIGGVDGNGAENYISVSEMSATGTVIPSEFGDYNADGRVNIADYPTWRDNLNSTAMLANDPTPGAVTEGDRAIWSQFFGYDNSVGAGLGQEVAVPEPSALWMALLMGGAVGAVVWRRGCFPIGLGE